MFSSMIQYNIRKFFGPLLLIYYFVVQTCFQMDPQCCCGNLQASYMASVMSRVQVTNNLHEGMARARRANHHICFNK